MKIIRNESDYPSQLSPAYRKALATADNWATAIIMGIAAGFIVTLSVMLIR